MIVVAPTNNGKNDKYKKTESDKLPYTTSDTEENETEISGNAHQVIFQIEIRNSKNNLKIKKV